MSINSCLLTPQDGGYEFGMDRVSLRELITSALPTARALTGDLWDAYVEHDQEMLYPLELFAAIAFQCHGLSRYVHRGLVLVSCL